LPARAHDGGRRAPVRDALALPPARDRARRAPLGAARSPRRPLRRLRRGRRVGARQLVRHRRRRAALRLHVRAPELVSVRRRRGSGESRGTLTEVTSGLAVLGVMGPRSRELLSRLTDADLSSASFPFGTAREIEVGSATVRATRITYVGELGWELYVPAEFALGAYEDVVAAGADLGLRHAGYHAMDSLRMEKGYRSWGHDVGC